MWRSVSTSPGHLTEILMTTQRGQNIFHIGFLSGCFRIFFYSSKLLKARRIENICSQRHYPLRAIWTGCFEFCVVDVFRHRDTMRYYTKWKSNRRRHAFHIAVLHGQRDIPVSRRKVVCTNKTSKRCNHLGTVLSLWRGLHIFTSWRGLHL